MPPIRGGPTACTRPRIARLSSARRHVCSVVCAAGDAGRYALLGFMINPLNHVKAGFKYLLSFRKDEWNVSDYPIRFRHFSASEEDVSRGRLKPIPWSAQIINWWQMDGLGDTKEAAFTDLKAKLQTFKEEGKFLPRPGTELPIEFAPSDRVSLHWEIAEDFFKRILEMNYQECWISDQSSLWDFHREESNDHLHEKVWEAYRVDISDIGDGNLVRIFERIENR
ncbi:MAG: hypothetical protein LC776_00770 [Acidobacteria bacterium]|nr:hypothetical protein [Acidobacteriota bacterium]